MSLIKSGMSNQDYEKEYLRDAVGKSIMELAQINEKICFVSANVMSSCRVLESTKIYKERSSNVGISEQEMISFSAGLAMEGMIPFAFTMAPFMSMRACEQVRTDVAYNHLNVKMIAPYAGVSGGISGATHWAIEDCAIMRGIPNIVILEPSTPILAKKMIESCVTHEGPIYMRIGIEPVAEIYDDNIVFEIGKANEVIAGEDGAFICSGVLVKYAIIASKRICAETGKRIKVIDMHTIKPIDTNMVRKAAVTGRVVVAQDHNVVGGLGDAVASVIAQNGLGTKYKVLGVPDQFVVMAHAPYLYHKYCMDDEALYQTMIMMLNEE